MKIAIIGSRGLVVEDFDAYLPPHCTEIISGGARGIDACARAYAEKKGIICTEILPDYRRFGRGAPLRRNKEIVALCDEVIAFWDGRSSGTAFVIAHCKKVGKPCRVNLL